jgi:ABC-2 type transport system ATP-binding protein
MDAATPSLAIRELVKSYGAVRAVDGVSFTVGRGEIFGLLGRNGAGKTTLMECVLGLRQADRGTVRIGGMDARKNAGAVKGSIGAVLQATALQDAITPREALELFGAFYPRAVPASDLLKRFSLMEKGDARFETLSGGQRQRLALALALVNDPKLLCLDEPTSGLDPQVRHSLHGVIREFRAEGRAVLLTTHYIEEAESLCDRIAIMDRGKIMAMGRPEELVARVGGRARVIFRAARGVDLAGVGRLRGVLDAEEEGEGVSLKVGEETGGVIAELVGYLAETGNELVDLRVQKASLEEVFIELTGEGK